ncbi:MAG TPA: hypothetical protein VM617_06470, partial [Thermoanaerobaculia bacterium]|nr:hypothetical protein [Thermoanaerobaculia bacterium]
LERVRDELMLLFAGDGAHRGVASMLGLGVYPSLWLGEPGAPVGGEEEQGAAGAVGAVERLSARAEEVARLAAQAPPVDLPAARWALTFRPLAAPAATAVQQLEAFRDRGFLTREAAVRVARLVAESGVPVGERERRRFLHRLGAAWPTALAVFGAELEEPALDGWRREVAELAALVAADGERILDPPRLLSGADVQALLGLPPGRAIGEALERVRRAQVDGEIASRQEAEALLLEG